MTAEPDVLPEHTLPTLQCLNALLADPMLERVWADAVALHQAIMRIDQYRAAGTVSARAARAIADRLMDAAATPESREAAAVLRALPPPQPRKPDRIFQNRFEAMLHRLAITAEE